MMTKNYLFNPRKVAPKMSLSHIVIKSEPCLYWHVTLMLILRKNLKNTLAYLKVLLPWVDRQRLNTCMKVLASTGDLISEIFACTQSQKGCIHSHYKKMVTTKS